MSPGRINLASSRRERQIDWRNSRVTSDDHNRPPRRPSSPTRHKITQRKITRQNGQLPRGTKHRQPDATIHNFVVVEVNRRMRRSLVSRMYVRATRRYRFARRMPRSLRVSRTPRRHGELGDRPTARRALSRQFVAKVRPSRWRIAPRRRTIESPQTALDRGRAGIVGAGRAPNQASGESAPASVNRVATNSRNRAAVSRDDNRPDALSSSTAGRLHRQAAGSGPPQSSVIAVDNSRSQQTSPHAAHIAESDGGSARRDSRSNARERKISVDSGSGEVDLAAERLVSNSGSGPPAGGGQPKLSNYHGRSGRSRSSQQSAQTRPTLDVRARGAKAAAPLESGGGRPRAIEAEDGSVAALTRGRQNSKSFIGSNSRQANEDPFVAGASENAATARGTSSTSPRAATTSADTTLGTVAGGGTNRAPRNRGVPALGQVTADLPQSGTASVAEPRAPLVAQDATGPRRNAANESGPRGRPTDGPTGDIASAEQANVRPGTSSGNATARAESNGQAAASIANSNPRRSTRNRNRADRSDGPLDAPLRVDATGPAARTNRE